MGSIPPIDPKNSWLRHDDPPGPTQFRLNCYISTISTYIPEYQPFSFLRTALSYLRSFINGVFKFLYGKKDIPRTEKPSPKPTKSYHTQDLSSRSVLTQIFAETKKALDQGFYALPDGTKVTLDLEPMKKGTKMWTHDALQGKVNFAGRPTYQTVFETINTDTVLAGLKLKEEGLNPALLNMANRSSPGGGVVSGCLAQEEELCRKTALYVSISPADNPHMKAQTGATYKVPEDGCHYSPHVPVIRERKDDHFAWLSETPELSFISSAAYNMNARHHDQEVPKSPAAFEAGMRKKIRAQILAGLIHGHDSLVLGAFGCGAFCQDPEQVSQWYNEELAPYQKYFKKICFAVLIARDSDKANFAAFNKRFQ